MTERLSCPKCGGTLEQGIVLDVEDTHRFGETLHQARWVKIEPEEIKSGWLSHALKGISGRPQYQVEADRCTACGFLESYARRRRT
ncbi:MAG: hypothetical protein KDC98_01040 [Planctomycetes bacterium]|nr:hypothetical protein [Planctomycetota bacterium]